jgi:hypoxanthine phosphoribosyltransferase
MTGGKKSLCFVMMPSGNHGEYTGATDESAFIYKGIIVPALKSVYGERVKVEREFDSRKPGAITGEIIRKIAKADISIVDITGGNPNVFLELGIRYSLCRNTTILLQQQQKNLKIPFDIQNLRTIIYSPNFFGVDKAKEDIIEALRTLERSTINTDSLVFDVLPQLEVRIPPSSRKSLQKGQTNSSDMPWSTFWSHLSDIVTKIQDLFREGRFFPTTILGITNGGAMYADLLGRELFENVPVTSLWANRNHNTGNYFDNPINDAVVSGIQIFAKKMKKEKACILLVDDIVASGTTHKQALQYLKKKLPDAETWFLPLFSRNEKYFDTVKKHIIWRHKAFDLTDEEISETHWSAYRGLPYDKDIRST